MMVKARLHQKPIKSEKHLEIIVTNLHDDESKIASIAKALTSKGEKKNSSNDNNLTHKGTTTALNPRRAVFLQFQIQPMILIY